MSPLLAALRQKYGTPDKALAALGLSETLLATDGEGDPAGALLAALKRTPKMAKLNATALRVHSALTAILGPRLALDAQMPDLLPVVRGVTKSNLGKTKARIWANAKIAMKPVLAADQAGPDDVAIRILDMIDKQGASAEMEQEPVTAEAEQSTDVGPEGAAVPAPAPAAAEPIQTAANAAARMMAKKKPGEAGAEPEGEDDAGAAEKMKALVAKCGGDQEMAKACYDICMGGAKDEVVAPAQTETPSSGKAVDKRAKDEEAPMMKPAMDAAIKTAVTQAKEDMRAEARFAQQARQVVRPWVGEVSVAFDSADEIYKSALESLGVKTKGVHASAYRTILENLPKPGSSKRLAMDGVTPSRAKPAGSRSDLAKRFPHAASIQVLG